MAVKEDGGFDYYLERPTNSLQPDRATFDGPGPPRTTNVGAYRPNPLGLHDMHGNVWEWCEDELPPDDQGIPQRGHRGGCFINIPEFCRATSRVVTPPTHRDDGLGLRVARVPAARPGAKKP